MTSMFEIAEEAVEKHKKDCLDSIDKIYIKKMTVGQMVALLATILIICGSAVAFTISLVQKDDEASTRITVLEKDMSDIKARTKNLEMIPSILSGLDTVTAQLRRMK